MSCSGRVGRDYVPDWDDCYLLKFETRLSSPKADVVENLSVDDLLEMRLNNAPGAISIEAFHPNGLAGAITSSIKKDRNLIGELPIS